MNQVLHFLIQCEVHNSSNTFVCIHVRLTALKVHVNAIISLLILISWLFLPQIALDFLRDLIEDLCCVDNQVFARYTNRDRLLSVTRMNSVDIYQVQ